jgi:type II secretory pathway pseudopilin PulG
MKLRLQKQRNRALTIIEVLVIILLLFLLAVLLLPYLARPMSQGIRINCINNLKQINLAFHDWAGAHNNQSDCDSVMAV